MSISSQILGEMSTSFGKRSGFTHTGSFTADDILCAALCRVLNPDFLIYRTEEVPNNPAQDHILFFNFNTDEESLNLYNWKVNREYRSDKTRYQSFGLLWRDYGPYAILPWTETEEVRNVVRFMVDEFDEEYIKPFDVSVANDAWHPWIEMIENFNLKPNEFSRYPTHSLQVMFDKAVNYTTTFLERLCEKYKMACNSLVKIYKSYDPNGGMAGIVYLDDEMEIDTDWALEFVREHMDGINFMIRSSEVRGFNIYPVKKTYAQLLKEFPSKIDTPEKIGYAIYKTPFPPGWHGKRPEYLNDIYKGMFFCEKNASMATTEDYETAVLICKNLIKAYANTTSGEQASGTENDG